MLGGGCPRARRYEQNRWYEADCLGVTRVGTIGGRPCGRADGRADRAGSPLSAPAETTVVYCDNALLENEKRVLHVESGAKWGTVVQAGCHRVSGIGFQKL